VYTCACGRRTQLEANVLYHDPDAPLFVRACPDAAELDAALAQFTAAGASGTLRVVRTLNALIEKVKLVDAGLEDWAIELDKVLLLSTLGELDQPLWFERVDHDAGHLHWVLAARGGHAPQPLASPLAGYDQLVQRAASRPSPTERVIDRAWAIRAAELLVAAAN